MDQGQSKRDMNRDMNRDGEGQDWDRGTGMEHAQEQGHKNRQGQGGVDFM